MKKLISMLLAVLMVASLFTGMSVSAYADDDDDSIISYTMKEGDTVLKVCTAYGINYYTCKNAIMSLNGFTSDSDFRYIPVGKVIKIPASNAAATTIASAGTTSTSSSTAVTTSSSGDSIAYYLVPHTMQRGETIYTVCSALGISYSNYASQIQKINNLSSLTNVKAGQTILFPQTTTPSVGTTCYAVKKHAVTSGETAYTICNNNGISYNGNLKLLQALNNKDNLNYITAGSSFYVPVQTTIAAASTSTTATTTGTTTTVSTGSSTSTSSTSSDSSSTTKTYALTATSTSGGSTTFYVNNTAVTSAAAGDVVTVVATPDDNYAVSSIEVRYSDGTAEPNLVGDTFVMPANAVTATVTFIKGYDITISCPYTNGAKAMVDGVTVSSAAQSSSVSIVSNNTSLSIKGKIDIYRASNNTYVKSVTPSNGVATFDMPSYDIIVEVEMKTVDTYGFTTLVINNTATSDVNSKDKDKENAASATGSIVLQVNGSTVKKAAEGTTVTVLASPTVGYELSTVSVYSCDDNGKRLTKLSVKNGNSFTMPGNDVEVVVSFAPESAKINIQSVSHGTMYATLSENGNKTTYANTGETVYLKATPDDNYTAEKPIVTSTLYGYYIDVESKGNGTYSFTMPGGGAEVLPQFVGSNTYTLKWVTYVNDTQTDASVIRYTADGKTATNNSASANEGQLVKLGVDANAGYSFVKYKVYIGEGDSKVYDADMTASANDSDLITVAGGSAGNYYITIEAYFEADSIPVSTIYDPNNQWVIYWVAENNLNKSVNSVDVGSYAYILLDNWSDGKADISKPVITAKETGETIDLKEVTFSEGSASAYRAYVQTYKFVMPAGGVNITVSTTPRYYSLSFADADKYKNVFNDAKFLQVSTGDSYEQVMFDSSFKRTVTPDTTVQVCLSDEAKDAGYVLTSITYSYTPYSHTDVTTEGTVKNTNSATTKYIEAVDGVCTFEMPASDVVITEVGYSLSGVKTSEFQTNLSNCSITYLSESQYNNSYVDPLIKKAAYVRGETVVFRLTASSGYTIDETAKRSVVVKDLETGEELTYGYGITSYGNGYFSFTLPKSGNIRITASATGAKPLSVTLADESYGSNVTITTRGVSWTYSNTNIANQAYAGESVTITLSGTAKTTFTKLQIGDNTYSFSNGSCTFTMPSTAVTLVLQ